MLKARLNKFEWLYFGGPTHHSNSNPAWIVSTDKNLLKFKEEPEDEPGFSHPNNAQWCFYGNFPAVAVELPQY